MIKSETTNGLFEATFENLPNMIQIRCAECDRWVNKDDGKEIVHSKSCESKPQQGQTTQPVKEISTLKSNRDGRGNGLTSEELVANVQRGYLTISEAMNTDF